MPIDCDVFNNGLASVRKSSMERNRKVFKVEFNKELHRLLGARWDERIMNNNGDFTFVEEGTVKFWCIQEIPLENSSSWEGNIWKLPLNRHHA